MMNQPPSGHVRSLDKAMDILQMLASENHGLPLNELATRLGFKDSTAHHLVATLRRRGFVDQDPQTKAYRLGYAVLGLVNEFLSHSDIYAASVDLVRELRDLSGETSYLTTLNGENLVTVIEMLGSRPIQCRRPVAPGQSVLHSTASGKALLACLPQERASALLSTLTLTKFTANTITTLPALQDELAGIRHNGYAFDREENLDGVRCVAAVVFRGDRSCAGTVSVAFPAVHVARQDELTRLVRQAATKISANLGYVRLDVISDVREHAIA